METNFNFKSQICTDKNQSERLLALGLKAETADMCLQSTLNDVWSPYIPIAMPYSKVEAFDLSTDVFRVIPAWSLHRLIEICDTNPHVIYTNYTYWGVIDRIEEYIKEGDFNKDYLV